MFEDYSLTFPPGTNIHVVTFSIIAFEIVMLFFQIIVYSIRPSDKGRLWFLILLFLLILYNISGGLFPDPRMAIPLFTQEIIAYSIGIIMSLFLPFYIYKFLNIKALKFYAYYGSLYFLILPFIILFIIPYYITRDVVFSTRLLVIVPFFYSISLLLTLQKSVKGYIRENKDTILRMKTIGVSVAFLFWTIGLTIIVFFNGSQLYEHIVTNSGFLLLSVIYVYSTIIESRLEYQKLLDSEENMKKLNEILLQKVKERTKELELATEQRTNAVISLAHETRTPLTLITCYLDDLISKYGSNEETDLIQSCVKKLNKDVSLFFDEERVRKGSAPVYDNEVNMDLSSFVLERFVSFSAYSKKKGISFTKEINPGITVNADPDALHCICNNLIENAIKYTPADGSVEVGLTLVNDKISFYVKDSGCGIPDDKISQIFVPYLQLNNAREGLGMGLAIVYNCVKSLGGKVVVKSLEGIGSEFIVELNSPSKSQSTKGSTSANSVLNTEIPQDAISNPNNPGILIVEDNLQLITYLRNKLSYKYNIYTAVNGSSALQKLKKIPPPNLIISDVMMDEMDGIRFFKYMLEMPALKHIPVIFLTARTSHEKKYQALALGAIDYIVKPFSINELILKIDSLISVLDRQKEAMVKAAMNFINTQEKEPERPKDSMLSYHENCMAYNITNREKEIILYISEGLSYKEIAQKLNVSEKTILKHKQNIFEKVDVSNKLELLKKMMSN